jgi:hypothetical protein
MSFLDDPQIFSIWKPEILCNPQIAGLRACNESSKGLRKRGVYQKKGAILGRVTLIADIRNKWLAGLALPVFAIGN